MTNRKLGFAALLAAVAAFGVAACNPKPAEEAAPSVTEETMPPADMSAVPPVESAAPSVTP
jgi:hypothetical protein